MGSESSHPRQAEILDQLSLFQFLQGKLPEAEMHARRSLAVIQNHFEIGDPAVCMCELRLGAILFSKPLLSLLLLCLVTMTGACCLGIMTGICCLVTMMSICCSNRQMDRARSYTLCKPVVYVLSCKVMPPLGANAAKTLHYRPYEHVLLQVWDSTKKPRSS